MSLLRISCLMWAVTFFGVVVVLILVFVPFHIHIVNRTEELIIEIILNLFLSLFFL
jgi:hypothetical protein